MDHDGLVFLRNGVEGFLNDMAAEGVHAQAQGVATDSVGNSNDLLGGTVLKAALDQEIAEAVDHQRICLSDDGFNDFIFLLDGPDLELLLQEDGRLLIIVADNLIDDISPIA